MSLLEKYYLEPKLFLVAFLEGERSRSHPDFLAKILEALFHISQDWRVLLVARPIDARCGGLFANALSRSLVWVETIAEEDVAPCISKAALLVTDCPRRVKIAADHGVRSLYLGRNTAESLVDVGWVIEQEPENPVRLVQSFEELIRFRARTY